MLERAHVVQAIGELDHDDADVVDHGQHHLADALGLGLFTRGEFDFADLRDALNDVRHLFAELGADVIDRDRSVFDGVVQQAGGDGRGVEAHVGENARNFEGMDQVGLTGGAGLTLMMAEGKLVGLFNYRKIVVWAVLAYLSEQIAKAGNSEDVGCDLLAESRHKGLYEKVCSNQMRWNFRRARVRIARIGVRMRVVMSGASGMIGSALRPALAGAGHAVKKLVTTHARNE